MLWLPPLQIEQEANQEQRKHGSSNEDNLATVFRAAVGAEHNRTKKIAVAREKVVNVLTRENSLLKDRRQEFKQRSQIFHARNKRLEEQREQLRQDLKRRYSCAVPPHPTHPPIRSSHF